MFGDTTETCSAGEGTHRGYVQDGRTWKDLCRVEDARTQEGAGCMSLLSWKSRERRLVSSDRKQICRCLGVPKGQEEVLRVPRVHYSNCGDGVTCVIYVKIVLCTLSARFIVCQLGLREVVTGQPTEVTGSSFPQVYAAT